MAVEEARRRVGGTSEYDTLFAALARRSMRLAQVLEKNATLQQVVQKIVHGVERYCQVHNVRIEDARVDATLTAAGKVIVSISPPTKEAWWRITVDNPQAGEGWFPALEGQSFKSVRGPSIPVPSLRVGDQLVWPNGTIGTVVDVERLGTQ